MNELSPIEVNQTARLSRQKLKKIGWFLLLALLALPFGLYVLVSQPAFIRLMVLPSLSTQLAADLQADDIDFAPFSSLHLSGVTLVSPEGHDIFAATSLHLAYDWWRCLMGEPWIEQCTLTGLEIQIDGGTDPRSPFDDWLASLPETDEAPLPRFFVEELLLKNLHVKWHQLIAENTMQAFDLRVEDLAIRVLGQEASASYAGTIGLKLTDLISRGSGKEANLESSVDSLELQTVIQGQLGMDRLAAMELLESHAAIRVIRAEGRHQRLEGAGASFDMLLKSQLLESLSLRFEDDKGRSQELSASGALDFSKGEARVAVHLEPISETSLNLLGALAGIGFQQGELGGDFQFVLEDGAQKGTLEMELQAASLAVEWGQEATPISDYRVSAQSTWDQTQGHLIFENLRFMGSQGDRVWVEAALEKPWIFNLKPHNEGEQEAPRVGFYLKQARLDPWLKLLQQNTPIQAGSLDADGWMSLELDEWNLLGAVNLKLSDADLIHETLKIEQGTFSLNLQGGLRGMNQPHVERLEAQLSDQEGIQWASASLRVPAVGDQRSAPPMELKASANLVPWLTWMQAASPLTQGTLEVNAQLTPLEETWQVACESTLKGLRGDWLGLKLDQRELKFHLDGDYRNQVIRVSDGSIEVSRETASEASIGFQGSVNLPTQQTDLEFQIGLLDGMLLTPWFGLSSNIEDSPLSGSRWDLQAHLKSEDQLTGQLDANLSVENLGGTQKSPADVPPKRFAGGIQLHGKWSQDAWELLPSQIDLKVTGKEPNELTLSGRGLHHEMAIKDAGIQITGDFLDLDEWLALMSWQADSEPSDGNTQPEVGIMGLPGDLPSATLQAQLKRVVYAGTTMDNLELGLQIAPDLFVVAPFTFHLEEAPVVLALEMKQAEATTWTTELSLEVEQLPAHALVSVISGRTGQSIPGTISMKGKLQGFDPQSWGLDETSTGQWQVDYQGADLKMVGPWTQRLLLPITGALRLPTLFSRPVDSIKFSALVERNQLEIAELLVQSSAFEARTQGSVLLEDPIGTSRVDLPVEFKLERSLANKANLVSRGVSQNEAFVALPPFLHLTGNLNDLRLSKDAWKLGGMALRSAIGLPNETVKETVKVVEDVGRGALQALEGLGGLLGNRGLIKPRQANRAEEGGQQPNDGEPLPEQGVNLLDWFPLKRWRGATENSPTQ